MIYGVKVIHTHAVGDDERRFYEEIILSVKASSFDEAYEKAGRYMENCACDYVNPDGERVRTAKIEAIDCFLASEPENDVQGMFSVFRVNRTLLPEADFYEMLADSCDGECRALRSKEFN